MTNTIIINDITKSFGDKRVLTDIDFTMEAGKIYGFIGPSSVGKTTLVRLIVGMEQPTMGSIYVLDNRVPNMSLLKHIGFMSQSDSLYLHLTGYENLKFYTALFTMKKHQAAERIEYTARLVGLRDDLSKKVCYYSSDMRRRLSLAIALLHNPDILVLDEPTVGTDPTLRQQIWDALYMLKELGKTIIVTTHVMDEAEHCDIVALIDDGRILTDGTPNELKSKFNAQTFDEVFIRASENGSGGTMK